MFAGARRSLFALILAAGLSQPALADGPQDTADEKAEAQEAKNSKAKAKSKSKSKANTKSKAKAGTKANARTKAGAKKAETKGAKPASGAKATGKDGPATRERAANEAAAATDAAPAERAAAAAPLHRRTRVGSTGLAAAEQRLRGPRAAQRVKKDESQVERAQVETARREVAKSPVESLLDDLHGEVLRAKPKARGKINISFRVGRGGVPANVMILGFDESIDVALEKRVQAARLPASFAGRQISTTLNFRGK